jgi:DNA invertase Pin-like site-specific DNA recombinase
MAASRSGSNHYLYKKGFLLTGEQNPNSKLNWDKVREIRKRYKEEKISGIRLAKEFLISKSQIFRILNNRQWVEQNNEN